MSDKLTELLGLLDLEQIEESIFRAGHPASRTKRLFGGQIMAQALMAAMRTVELGRCVNSLHGYFLRPGTPRPPGPGRAGSSHALQGGRCCWSHRK